MTAVSTVEETAPARDDVAGARGRFRPLRWLFVLVLAVVAAQLAVFLVGNSRFQWDVVAKYLFEKSVLAGLGTTVLLALAAMVLGSLAGGVVAAMQLSGFAPARWVATLWVGLFRGIPPLVQLIFWFNLAYLLPRLSIGVPFGPVFGTWDANTVITPLTAAVIGLSLVESAYLAEIFRAGVLSVDPGQRDAARAMGYPPGQTLLRIVLPQAMRVIIPPAGSQFINVLKGTALVSVIAMSDLLHSVQVIYNRTYEIVPMLVVACFWYLVVVTALTAGQRRLERRFSRGHRSAR
ncbi:amino acid ABC transporter permease [Amycolatopsis sp. NPDC004169]|uniref:amino acid ABC transporter permease n=1 Tax=Amycolatopsis sp. NPDC004169 TaxID=3154453 RepID=UPI0033AE5E15